MRNDGSKYEGCTCYLCQSKLSYHEKYAYMVLCPSCGNKRCPKTAYHELECTGSNDLNQVELLLAAAQERIRQYEEDFRKVITEECASDEKHCSCVPHLRRRIAELESDKKPRNGS